MPNVRFITGTQNKGRKQFEGSAFPRLINGNGSYSGNPPLLEDPQFPMANVMYPGRTGRIWHGVVFGGSGNDPTTGYTGSNVVLDVDLGSQVAVAFIGWLGSSLGAGQTFPSSGVVEFLPSPINTYNATTGWSSAAAVGGFTQRDYGQVIAPLTGRFWRFRWFNAALFDNDWTVASLILATAPTDLGFLYSGMTERLVRPRTLVEGYGRQPTITKTGDEYALLDLEYKNTDTATKTIFDGLYREPSPFVYLDPFGTVRECVFADEDWEKSHIWAPPDRWRTTVTLRSLP